MFQLKTYLIKKLIIFYRHIRLKLHFEDTIKHLHFSEDEIDKNPSSESLIPPKNHHTVKTYTEAANNDTDAEIKRPKHSKLSKREQKALQKVKDKIYGKTK